MNPVVTLLETMKLSGNPLLPAPMTHKEELRTLGLMGIRLRKFWTILPEQVPATRIGVWTCLERDTRRVTILASLNAVEGTRMLKGKSRSHEAHMPGRKSLVEWYPWLSPTTPSPTDNSAQNP